MYFQGVGKNNIDASISQPDFNSLGYSVTSSRQGVYEFTTTISNSGIDSATTGSVSIPWETLSYDLPLVNGSGTLEESIATYDINGDGDTLDSYGVTWYNDTIRQWDAIINDGGNDYHVYAITESPPGEVPIVRNYTYQGESKLFSIDSETHFLYRANNDTASFGFGGFLGTHSGPNFELVLLSSKVTAIDFKINENPMDVAFSTIYTATEDYLLNTPTLTSIYVVPTATINPGEETIFSCTLIAHEATTFDVVVILNWSPDGITRYHWVPVWDSISLEAINRPHFVSVDSSFTQVIPGSKQFMVTVKNIGAPATTGTVPIAWEKATYDVELTDGVGILIESAVGFDLNGDDDIMDSFEVTWFHNDTRNWDAIVNDGVQDLHTYSLWEGPPENRRENRSYYLDGKPKLFQLGTETHFLVFADETVACFGLGEGIILQHPSPNFELVFEHRGTFSSIVASNMELNGSAIEINYTREVLWYPYWEDVTWVDKFYIVPNQAIEINTGEIMTFSCTLTSDEDITSHLFLLVNWSPDENIRYHYIPFSGVDETFEAADTSTTSTTTTTTTSTKGTPGFLLLPLIILVPVLIPLTRKKS
jgi:hypothetical protein